MPGEFQERKVTFGLTSLAAGCKVPGAASEAVAPAALGCWCGRRAQDAFIPPVFPQVRGFAGAPVKEERSRPL